MNLEQQVLRKLQQKNWKLVDPDMDAATWKAFVTRVKEYLGQEQTSNLEHRIQRVLIAAYGEVLYAAAVDSSNHWRQEQAYLELHDWIYRRVISKVDLKDDAKDLTQEILEIVHRNLDKVNLPRVFLAYIGQIIWRKLSEYYRKKKNHIEHGPIPNGDDENDLPDDLSQWDVLAELMIGESEAELIAKIDECMPARAGKQKKVLVLAAFGPFSPDQIAKHLHIKTGNVYTLLSRARANFIKHCFRLLKEIVGMTNPAMLNQLLEATC